MNLIEINPDIKKAVTLPSVFYNSAEYYELSKEKIFANSWQFVGDSESVRLPGQVHPFTLLEGCIDEPLLLTRDQNDKIHCLSNVCTHRGNILIESPVTAKVLQCRYHGRRFELNGSFRSMPECEDAENFPREEDNLSKVKFGIWNKFIFVSPNSSSHFDDLVKDMTKRLEGVNIGHLNYEPSRSRDYIVKANWALYCDNYLEGFHIPYVHAGLNEKIDYGSYTTELYAYSNLQLGIAKRGEECFTLHETSPDYGSEVAAYYWWLFPNTMFNFYPWGLSINVVKPIAKDMTKVSFITYVSDCSKLETVAGAGLDRVEREDEAIVEQVQKGMKSRFYSRGRYSPKREQGVHHFHMLISKFLNDNHLK